ncbi:amidohydrolase family protein [Actinomadura graeca]|uniref:Amidohydrolase family protein n=1 Tax=Actinomadura graeca TaxID=2750812 RepID=A0ABX8QWA3_9ACTN|nr:amidohydrolase family protein [Actinomadura graeca]QXJ22012.1 amidohydrolase family protein [Actinomadura graeca]
MSTLFRVAHVLSMDPDIGDFSPGEVLVEGDRITAVGTALDAPPGTERVDVPAGILVPGFVDTHRHMWEALLRGGAPHHTLDDYMSDVLGRFGPVLGPHDLHLGTLLSARAALTSGITTVQDISNIQDSPDATDAVVAAHRASGLRTVFAYGKSFPAMMRDGFGLPGDLRRVRAELLPDPGGLVTMAVVVEGGDDDVERRNAAVARDLGLRVARHFSAGKSAVRLRDIGALVPGTVFIHANDVDDAELAVIAESGGSVSVSPAVELMMGHGYPMMKARHRVPISLSTDVEVTVPADMFTQMRAAYQAGRHAKHAGWDEAAPSVRDVLHLATLAGARALGLDGRTGSLTPGKRADLLLLRAGRPDVAPVLDPYSTVVLQMDRAHVDTVLVDGRTMVRDGRPLTDDTSLLDQARAVSRQLAPLLAGRGR